MTPCPCCRQTVKVPTLDVLIQERAIDGTAERVLRAIWRGRGLPVQSSDIFDAMYADDPNGGPSQCRMYRALGNALQILGERLQGAGVSISPVGHRRGYRLGITEGE
jgi:hypothetical protein